MAGRRGGEGIRDGDLAGKRETEKTRGRRKRIRTTSTPRFLATAMTVLRVPKSTPVGWETQGLGQPRTRIWLCDAPPKRTGTGTAPSEGQQEKLTDDTHDFGWWGLPRGTRALAEGGYGEREEVHRLTGGGRERVGESSWGCGMESEKGVWAGLFFCRVEGEGGGVMINGGEDWDDKLS